VDLNDASLIVVGRFERNPERGHTLVHKQKVTIVALCWFALESITNVAFIALAFIAILLRIGQTPSIIVANTLVLVASYLTHAPITVAGESL
jgi:hypothetical protein